MSLFGDMRDARKASRREQFWIDFCLIGALLAACGLVIGAIICLT